MTFYTMEEVASHNTKESCWIVANNNVYDATNFINRHPGGSYTLLSKAGTDVTKHFEWHSTHAKKLWAKHKIGEIQPVTKCCYCLN